MGVKVVRKSGRKGWYIQVCEGGRRYLRHVGSREASYASKKDIEEALATGAFVPPKAGDAAEGILFRDAIGRWKKEHVEVKLKPSSKRYYGSIIDGWLLPAFGDKEVGVITRADIKAVVARWKEEREKAPVEETSPAPAERKKTRMRKAGQGLRSIPNALRALRSFFSWAIAAESLEAGRSMPERVFVNEAGKSLDETKVSKAHHSALKVAGLRRIRIHDLRGTFASLLVSAGVPLFHVAKALGHSSQETTMRHYAHLAPGAAKEMPGILERYVFGDPAGPDANGGLYR